MDSYHHHHHHNNKNPSFSSTLLDAIYRSIDFEAEAETETETHHHHHQEVVYRETMRKKQSGCLKNNSGCFRDEEEMANYQRACLIEKWMEKKVVVRRTEYDAATSSTSGCTTFLNSSSSISSDSSSGTGGFSPSEVESSAGYGVSSSRTSCYGLNKPKPIRTSANSSVHLQQIQQDKNKVQGFVHPKAKQESAAAGSFVKTKSRALKIYGDLKKVKQPISPGGRLASFLNSIFTAGAAKKAKLSSPSSSGADRASRGGVVYDDGIINSERKLKSANASTCSSASSFSRSCLSKTPSSRGKSSGGNGLKRSVRFYPVSVIVDEDSQPCGQKSLYDDDKTGANNNIRASLKTELQFQALEKNRRVQEAARDLLRNFQMKKVVDQCGDFDMIRNNNTARINNQEFQNLEEDDQDDEEDEDVEEDDDEDDDASYASSDLFELDNLSAIGMERYREELPVYETTHLGTNRAIANGLIL